MRNWNSKIGLEKRIELGGFEPTYEELKQYNSIKLSFIFYRFEPTYEELKHKKIFQKAIFLTLIWAYLWGIETNPQGAFLMVLRRFEPTYEELKLEWSERLKRKWIRIWAYLWGIET